MIKKIMLTLLTNIVVIGLISSCGGNTGTITPGPSAGTPTGKAATTPVTRIGRSCLQFEDMIAGTVPDSPVDYSCLAPPPDRSMPKHVLEGEITVKITKPAAAHAEVILDRYGYATASGRLRIPDMRLKIVQNGEDLIPVQRGLIITDNPYWNYIVDPGKAWQEPGDHGFSRASIPFALVEKNANCTHNGVMSFLFDDRSISNVYYQMTQETCYYFKGNFWGMASATYSPFHLADAKRIEKEFKETELDRMPVQPIAVLEEKFPDFDLHTLTSGISDMTLYGIVVDGTNYVGGGETRSGKYPYLDYMRLPSYSTAKSAFVAVAYMLLKKEYGEEVENIRVRDYLEEHAGDSWDDVSLTDLLDMTSGHYVSTAYMEDENSHRMSEFFEAETYRERLDIALSWPRRSRPGSTWVYHTSDSFLATQVMENFLREKEGKDSDIYRFVVDKVYKPIGMEPGAWSTLRTNENNWHGRPLGGYGLFWVSDDIAKLSTFLNVNGGRHDGRQIIDAVSLAQAMQKVPSARGFDTAGKPFKYNHGFWAHRFVSAGGCGFWVPFMSGFGGITVAMMPNGVTFYYFSDNGDYDWYDVVYEIDAHIYPDCHDSPAS